MEEWIAALARLTHLGKQAVQGACGARILAWIEKRGRYFDRGMILEAFAVELSEDCFALRAGERTGRLGARGRRAMDGGPWTGARLR